MQLRLANRKGKVEHLLGANSAMQDPRLVMVGSQMSPKNATGPFILPDPSQNTSMLNDPKAALKTQFKQDLIQLS